MNSPPALKTVTFLSAPARANSSTGSYRCHGWRRRKPCTNPGDKVRVSGEVCLLPMAWRQAGTGRKFRQPVDALEERKESVFRHASQLEIPNRKERLFSAFQPLLIYANTSGMRLFADQQQRQNAAAGEVVMDRGAECTAGGCDAI